MNFIAGLLLLVAEEEHAFWLLSALVEKQLPNYFSPDMFFVRVDQLVLVRLLGDSMRELHEHLLSIDFAVESITMQWFLTCFIGFVPTETVLRIFDALMCRGAYALFVTAFGLLQLNESALMRTESFGDAFHLLKSALAGSHDISAVFAAGTAVLKPHIAKIPKLRLEIAKQLSASSKEESIDMLLRETSFSRAELDALHRQFAHCVVRVGPPHCSVDSDGGGGGDGEDDDTTSDAAIAAAVASSSNARAMPALRKGTAPQVEACCDGGVLEQAAQVTRGLDKARFREVLTSVYTCPFDVIDKLFSCFDRERSGLISFSEFVVGVFYLARGSAKQKLELAFDIFDVENTNSLTLGDLELLLGIVRELHSVTMRSAPSKQWSAAMLMQAGDTAGNGTLSRREWLALMDLPELESVRRTLQSLCTSTALQPAQGVDYFEAEQDNDEQFGWTPF
jgi:Ca2+-binding EF-hand superfamily protein